MQDILLENYLILKSLHIIAMVAWMAGLLYLPRLFVYHAEAKKNSDLSETFKVMEQRLLRYIMNPAMIAVWVFGLLMITANPGLMSQGWLHAKFTLVILMSVFHMFCARWRKKFLLGQNDDSAKFFRIINEIPTLLMIAIVVLAVTKPF